jgi:hypothetical protein
MFVIETFEAGCRVEIAAVYGRAIAAGTLGAALQVVEDRAQLGGQPGELALIDALPGTHDCGLASRATLSPAAVSTRARSVSLRIWNCAAKMAVRSRYRRAVKERLSTPGSIGPFVARERFVGAKGLRTCCIIGVCGRTALGG